MLKNGTKSLDLFSTLERLLVCSWTYRRIFKAGGVFVSAGKNTVIKSATKPVVKVSTWSEIDMKNAYWYRDFHLEIFWIERHLNEILDLYVIIVVLLNILDISVSSYWGRKIGWIKLMIWGFTVQYLIIGEFKDIITWFISVFLEQLIM